jgi:hypothetical protein
VAQHTRASTIRFRWYGFMWAICEVLCKASATGCLSGLSWPYMRESSTGFMTGHTNICNTLHGVSPELHLHFTDHRIGDFVLNHREVYLPKQAMKSQWVSEPKQSCCIASTHGEGLESKVSVSQMSRVAWRGQKRFVVMFPNQTPTIAKRIGSCWTARRSSRS